VSIENITTDELRKIYIDRQIDNWSQLGGADIKINALTRNRDSGSYALMDEFVLKGEKVNDEIERDSMMTSMFGIVEDVINNNISPDSLPLGYTLYYSIQNSKKEKQWDNLKILNIDGIEPNDKTISSGEYPYSTFYYAVIRSDTDKDSAVRKLISWLLASEGQKIISNAGFGNIAR
jgi:phosphate transport system substrate-binding protein